jgi:hypothetical protein
MAAGIPQRERSAASSGASHQLRPVLGLREVGPRWLRVRDLRPDARAACLRPTSQRSSRTASRLAPRSLCCVVHPRFPRRVGPACGRHRSQAAVRAGSHGLAARYRLGQRPRATRNEFPVVRSVVRVPWGGGQLGVPGSHAERPASGPLPRPQREYVAAETKRPGPRRYSARRTPSGQA